MDDYPVAGERWTEAEVEYLGEHYRGTPSVDLSASMGRSPAAIRMKAWTLGLSSVRQPGPRTTQRRLVDIWREQERRAGQYLMALSEGVPARQVAARFNVTKNAVIGTCYRYRKRTAPATNMTAEESI